MARFRPLFGFVAFTLSALVHGQPLGTGQVGVTNPTPDMEGVRIVQKIGDRVPLTAIFLDEDGHRVKFGDFIRSRPAVILPIFYRCKGVCNLELQAAMAAFPKMKERIGRDFDVIVLSINPKEGPELSKAKLESVLEQSPAFKETRPGWHFLTGSYDQILTVTEALGFEYKYDAEKDVVNHPSGIMFLTPTGVISSYILGASYTPEVLSRNVDLAATNRLGPKAEDIFFGCVHVDPITGQRSLVVLQALKVAGVVTLLAIGAAIFTWSRKRVR